MLTRLHRFVSPLCALLAAGALGAACSHDKTSADGSAAMDDSASCATDPRVSVYAPNQTVTGNGNKLVFTLQGATPAPPAQGLNTWQLHVGPPGGTPSSSYALSVAPYMPDHGHGPSVNPNITVSGDGYVVGNIDFFMGGVWRITVTASDTNNTPIDSANFFYCVPG